MDEILYLLNTSRPKQDGCQFPDDIFKCIFVNETFWILIAISLRFVPRGPVNNIAALVQIMASRRPGGKPLSEPMMVSLLTHICVTRPRWLKPWMQLFIHIIIFCVSLHLSNAGFYDKATILKQPHRMTFIIRMGYLLKLAVQDEWPDSIKYTGLIRLQDIAAIKHE